MRKKTILILVISLVLVATVAVLATIILKRRDNPTPISEVVPAQDVPPITKINTLSADEVIKQFPDTTQAFDSLMSRGDMHYFVGDYSSSLEFFNASSDLANLTQEQRESALARLYVTYRALGENEKMTDIQERLGEEAFNRLNAPVDDLTNE